MKTNPKNKKPMAKKDIKPTAKMKTNPKLLKITMTKFNKSNLVKGNLYNVKELSTAFEVTHNAILRFIKSLDYELVVRDVPNSILKAKRPIKYFKVEDIIGLILKRDIEYGK